ncbi:MAG: hypothetical protein COB49_00540 [Alphaproteobacteria bacterium]|nr:MAG: hypothetical protein COB49_00540 [Alphaproteobacteria bacterium]
MAYTLSQLDKLKAAYAEGVLEIEEDGRKVKFGSARDLQNRINSIEQELQAQSGFTSTIMKFERD